MNINKFKKYFAFTKAGILNSFAYKFSAFGWLLGDAVAILILYYLWTAIYANATTSEINGMTFKVMITYLIFARIVSALTFSSISFWVVGEDIYDGNISINLTKPINYRYRLMFSSVGSYLATSILMFIPLSIIASIALYFAIDLNPPQIEILLLFIVSSFISFLICDAFNFLVGQLAIFTNALFGLMITKNILLSFLSGSLLPVSFFPSWLQEFTKFMPFSSMVQTPVLILLGQYDVIEIMKMLGIQLLWFFILNFICIFTFGRLNKHIVSVGG